MEPTFVALATSPSDPLARSLCIVRGEEGFWHEGRTKWVANLHSSCKRPRSNLWSNQPPSSVPASCSHPARSGTATVPGESQAPESSSTQGQSLCPGTEHLDPGWGLPRGPLAPTEEPLSPQLLTFPPPTLWLATEEAASGPHTRPGVVLTGALWKVTAATTTGFEDQTVCVPHSYLWPRRPPPPPMALPQRWGLSRSQLCGCPQDSQARPAHNPSPSLKTNLPKLPELAQF